MEINQQVTEMVEKAIPLNMTCAIEKLKAARRREKLRESIVSLMNAVIADTHRNAGNTGAES